MTKQVPYFKSKDNLWVTQSGFLRTYMCDPRDVKERKTNTREVAIDIKLSSISDFDLLEYEKSALHGVSVTTNDEITSGHRHKLGREIIFLFRQEEAALELLTILEERLAVNARLSDDMRTPLLGLTATSLPGILKHSINGTSNENDGKVAASGGKSVSISDRLEVSSPMSITPTVISDDESNCGEEMPILPPAGQAKPCNESASSQRTKRCRPQGSPFDTSPPVIDEELLAKFEDQPIISDMRYCMNTLSDVRLRPENILQCPNTFLPRSVHSAKLDPGPSICSEKRG